MTHKCLTQVNHAVDCTKHMSISYLCVCIPELTRRVKVLNTVTCSGCDYTPRLRVSRGFGLRLITKAFTILVRVFDTIKLRCNVCVSIIKVRNYDLASQSMQRRCSMVAVGCIVVSTSSVSILKKSALI